MSRPVLLIEIGPAALPSSTQVSADFASWMPSVYEAPPPPVPAALAATSQLGGVRISWTASADAAVRYDLERAPDAAGSPGVGVIVYTGSDAVYNSNESARTHWRVRARLRGRVSAWSAWFAQVPDDPLNYVGGNGVNLLPDQYSTFANATLPTLQTAGGSVARDPGVAIVPGSASLKMTSTALDHYVYLGAASNISHTPGRKYLISAYFGSDVEPRNIECYVQMEDGVHVGLGTKTKVTGGAIHNTRLCWLADLSARLESGFRVRFDNEGGAGSQLWIDGIMVEPLVGNKIEPSAYGRGQAGGVALQALVAAQSAQATADGQIDIYRQASAPAIGGSSAKIGDYWQDSDDGRWWYCNGSSWVESPDNRLPQVVVDAANAHAAANTAQGTANARIRLFVQDVQPTGGTYIVGDMWFRPTYNQTRYFNGTAWSLQSDSAAANGDALCLNPAFEQADLYWSLNAGFYVEASTNAALSGSGMVHGPGTPNARIQNLRAISVHPGQVLSCYAAVRNLINGANGTANVGFVFFDKDGNFLTERVKDYASSPAMAGTHWRTVGGKFVVPYGATTAYVTGVVYGHTAGFWCFDNFRAALADSDPKATVSGENLVPNSTFSNNTGQFPINTTYIPIKNQFVCDGWMSDGVNGAYVANGGVLVGLEAWDSNRRNQLFVGDGGGTATPGSHDIFVRTGETFSVVPGERLYIATSGQTDQGTPRPAGLNINTFAGVNYYNKDGGDIGYAGRNVSNFVGPWSDEGSFVVPAGAAFCRPIVGGSWVNTTGGNLAVPWATAHMRFRSLVVRRVSDLDNNVLNPHGSIYGKPANEDLYDAGGVRRIGLNIKGSRKILGGARNARASLVYGAAAVRTNTALSANSSGQVTVNAHNVEISGETVTYNAVTNAVVGLTVGSTYVIFTLDPFLDGGTRTYYAQTSVLNAQQAGEGAVFIGNVTIPNSGTGSGGGGGGGGPGDWCVDYDSVLPDGRLVRDLQPGALVPCVDVRQADPVVEMHPLIGISFGEEDCYRLVTTELVSIIQSASTPMDLPNGQTRRTPEMLAQGVVVSINGKLRHTTVCDLQFLGQRRVAKPDLGNRMFLAGEIAEACIATHNATYKP